MAKLISIPATAQAELDAGKPYILLFSLTLPMAQGGVRTWSSSGRQESYNGVTYEPDIPIVQIATTKRATSTQGRGTIVFLDHDGGWEKLLRRAGRGNPFRCITAQPHNTPRELFPLMDFQGQTARIHTRHDSRMGRTLRMDVEDKLYAASFAPGEWTSDDYQRQLSAEANQDPYDNSHIIAQKSRSVEWHRR